MYAYIAEAVLLLSLVALGWWWRGRVERKRRKLRRGGYVRQRLGVSSLESRVDQYTMTGTRTAAGSGSLNTPLGLRSVATVTLRERLSANRTGAPGFSTDATAGHPGQDMTVASWIDNIRKNDPELLQRLEACSWWRP